MYELDINFYNFKYWLLIPLGYPYKSISTAEKKTYRNYQMLTLLNLEKLQYLPHYW